MTEETKMIMEQLQKMNVRLVLHAKVKDIGHTTITAELTGLTSLIDKFIEKMTKHGIIELSRSGLTALEKGDTGINGITE